MSWISDLGDEWKKAKTPEKVLIVAIVVAVVGIALYERNKAADSAQPAQASGTFSMPQSTGGAVPSGGGGVNVNSGGGTPTPSGGSGGSTGGSGGSGGSTGGSGGSGGSGGGNPPPPPNPNNPLIPYGSYQGPSYSNLKFGTTYTYNGTKYQLGAGSNGALWGVPVQGKLYTQQQWNNIPIAPGGKVLLYGPQSDYHTASSNSTLPQGGGPFGTRVSVRGGRRTPAPSREGQPTVLARVYSRRIA